MTNGGNAVVSIAFKRKANKIAAKIGRVITLLVIVILAIIFIWAQNKLVLTQEFIFESSKIPKTFVGYNIAVVSDLLEDTTFVESAIDKTDPNLVLFTGNFADSTGDYAKSVKLVANIAKKYPTAYVLGVHDQKYADGIKSALSSTGATNMEDSTTFINAPAISYDEYVDKFIEDKYIKLAANDPESSAAQYLEYTKKSLADDKDAVIALSGLSIMDSNTDFITKAYDVINLDRELFQILMINQGNYFRQISKVDLDLIVAGNSFGNPIGNNYTKGLYSENGTSMILSPGIADNPDGSKRILNFPTVVKITLSDGTINNANPLEKLLGYFIQDVNTRFEGDGGFVEHRYTYD